MVGKIQLNHHGEGSTFYSRCRVEVEQNGSNLLNHYQWLHDSDIRFLLLRIQGVSTTDTTDGDWRQTFTGEY